MRERIDITDYLDKLSDAEAEQLKSIDATLPMNYYIADSGDIYRAPGIGATPFYEFSESPEYKFRYNWRTKEIEVFTKSDDSNTFQFVESSPLTLYDFLNEETPEYWYEVYLKDLLKR